MADSPPRKHRYRQNVRRWKNAPETMTEKVNNSSSIPDPQGDSTISNTWSAQVIARNVASMIQMPYFFRKAGTGRFAPTSF